MTTEAFFDPLEQTDTQLVVATTDHARGPWDPESLHAGPPSALMVHAVDALHPADGRRTSRVTCEIHRPVPVARLTVTTHVVRPGRKIELVGATLSTDDGTTVMTAAVWRIRTAEVDLGIGGADDAVQYQHLPDPESLEPATGFFRELSHEGYMQAMEVRFVDGHWAQPGAATAWMRPRVALVAGRPLSGVERVLTAADSGNGISASFDGIFVNVDLSVHLSRPPVGEWVGLDAATVLTDHGVGYAHSTLHDAVGPIGRAAQSLLLDRVG